MADRTESGVRLPVGMGLRFADAATGRVPVAVRYPNGAFAVLREVW